MPQTGFRNNCSNNAWCIGGPFIGFHMSRDGGRTWDGALDPSTGARLNAFNNSLRQAWPAPPAAFHFKVMQPHFVDFGQNNAHSPDGYAYLVSQGCAPSATATSSTCGWVH